MKGRCMAIAVLKPAKLGECSGSGDAALMRE